MHCLLGQVAENLSIDNNLSRLGAWDKVCGDERMGQERERGFEA